MLKINNRKSLLANISIIFSSACVLHCLATPFMILLLPALAEFFSETVELILLLAILPLSLLGFFPTWLQHKNHTLLRIFVAGLALIIFSQLFMHAPHESLTVRSGMASSLTYFRTIIMFAGASMLAYSVYRNNKHTHVCDHKH